MQISLPFPPARLCALLLLAPLGLAGAPAHAQTTISFQNLTAQANRDGGISTFGPVYSTPSTQGFTFTTDSSFAAIAGDSTGGDGETSLYANNSSFTTLTQNNGQTFSFNAINLGPFLGNTFGSTLDGPTLFTGTRANGTTVTSTATTTGSTYQTFTFTGFTNLKSLTFAPAPGSGTASVFNTVVLNSPNGAAPVPEASTTISLGLLLALGGLAVAARRKKSRVSA